MFKKNETLTIEDIMQMTDEEVATLNEKLAKKLLKQIAITTAVSVAATVAMVKFADSLENDDTDED